MENIGKDCNGKVMFLDCTSKVVNVWHVDSMEFLPSAVERKDKRERYSQEIDADDYNKFLHRPCGAWFYDHICSKYNVKL